MDGDTAHEGLGAEDRALVAATAQRRAELELQGAAAFTLVTQALIDLRADAAIVELSARAIVEEMRHSEVYRALATLYSGREAPRPVPAPMVVPRHVEDPALQAAIHVVGMCAINETMACGFLDLCLAGATAPRVRAGLREVLSDEVRHGRIGWAWLASIPSSERSALVPWILPLLRAQFIGWRAQIATLPTRAVPEHGCPSATAIEGAMIATAREVVLPGFVHLGMDVSAARAFLD